MAMISVRRTPGRALSLFEHHRPLSVWDEVDRMMEELWERPIRCLSTTTWTFPMDMYEEKDALVLKLDLPGVAKDDIDLSFENNCLTIKAQKKQDIAEEVTSYSCERCFGQYTRTVCLPFPVEADKISTNFVNGVLEIRVPKTEEARVKKIEIKAGS